MANDLLWINTIPEDQPSWLLVSWFDNDTWNNQLSCLKSQLPIRWHERILLCKSSEEQKIRESLLPIRGVLIEQEKNIEITRHRLLKRLHMSWQSDLEILRRDKFKAVLKRTQWLVAGAVFASPVATVDLLSLTAVNGVMIKEMSEIWSCSCRLDSLQVVASQLAKAAIAQGVVEWSGQALLGVAKLDGSSWLATGAFQALSAAYLTRVVGSSMADWMALNNGVSEVDLESLKQQAPSFVEKALEKEKLDWNLFINQAKEWLKDGPRIFSPI